MRGCRHFVTLRVTLAPVTYRGLASSSRAELSAVPAHLLNCSMNAAITHLQFLQCIQMYLGKVSRVTSKMEQWVKADVSSS